MHEIHEQVAPGIHAIDTGYVRPRLDASHLLVDSGRAAFVDTGTSHSVPRLLQTLRDNDLDRGDVDYIFLTHIHLDHAGGAGALARELPNAQVVVHPRGARHMVDPSKLIAGTIAVYGEDRYRELYGELVPIAAGRIVESTDDSVLTVGGRQLRLIDTPGHALHHYSLIDEAHALAFTGDTFGVSYRETDTAAGPFIFPTTTPVHFDPGQLHDSIDRIMSYEPASVLLTHYSRVDDTSRLASEL
ncbi:MAG: MBL fold metallo-hydrolase, partial [Gammaproteobacteria bacterium]|nr:MBL fold metallo-hydrolase [Gammaproteobacteria bacterium]